MATGATHRGWKLSHNEGILAAVYNGVMPGTTLLSANTALDGVFLGTPVTPALAVDSLVLSNLVASGDFLLAANAGGNSQAWLWVDSSAGTMTLYAAGVEQLRTALGAFVVNEGSADIDFRVETNNLAYAIYSDGGKDALVLGSNTDTSSADQLITISRAARTATAATSYYDFIIAPAGAVTVPAGTTALLATARFNEPNVTATGTLTMGATVYVASQPTEGTQNAGLLMAPDVSVGLGAAGQARLLWESADTDANELLLQLPAGGATDVPVIIIGQSIENVNLGLYNGIVDPRIAMFGVGAVTTGPGLDFRKARGTVAAPTVVTSGDDLGTIRAYGAVAAGEYVQAAEIRFDMAGTIATTRGPGTITFLTATDNAPSTLTQAMIISAAQLVTCAAGVTVTTGNVTISAGDLSFAATASDILIKAATAAALEISDATTKFYAIDTRVATAGVITHTFNISAYTIASGAGNVNESFRVSAHTLNYTGTTQVTTEAVSVLLGARTIAGDTATLTVDKASTLKMQAPIEGTNITLTAASAIRIATTSGTPTNQYGIYVESLSGGTTANRGIYLAGANGIEFGAADDLIIPANTAAALEVSDGTNKLLAIDSRNTVTVDNATFTAPASQTLPNAATSQWRHVSLAAHTVTLVGQTQVTTVNQGAQLFIGAPTYAQSGGAVTVDQVSTVHIAAPVAGGSVTITANRMISTSVADCYLTGAGVWTDTICTQKVKDNIAPLDFSMMGGLLDQIQPVGFKYNAARLGAFDLDRQRYGVIAEQLPEFLRVPGEVNPSAMSGTILGAFALAGLRYLHEENKALKGRLAMAGL